MNSYNNCVQKKLNDKHPLHSLNMSLMLKHLKYSIDTNPIHNRQVFIDPFSKLRPVEYDCSHVRRNHFGDVLIRSQFTYTTWSCLYGHLGRSRPRVYPMVYPPTNAYHAFAVASGQTKSGVLIRQ